MRKMTRKTKISMIKSKNKSHINSLADLKKAKRKTKKQVKQTVLEMQDVFDGLPVKALGATATWMLASVVKGISRAYDKSAVDGVEVDYNATFKDKLMSAGQETLSFALSRVVETLLKR